MMMASTIGELWTAVGSLGTAIAVIVAAIQIWYATRQEKTEFEDSLAKEYREILGALPPSVLLQDPAANNAAESHFVVLYRYLDLSNEQTFLRSKGRIRASTWNDWCLGIRTNLDRHGFKEAWEKVKGKSFDDLLNLDSNGYRDPRQPFYARWWPRRRR
jgi:hypothetical protein